MNDESLIKARYKNFIVKIKANTIKLFFSFFILISIFYFLVMSYDYFHYHNSPIRVSNFISFRRNLTFLGYRIDLNKIKIAGAYRTRSSSKVWIKLKADTGDSLNDFIKNNRNICKAYYKDYGAIEKQHQKLLWSNSGWGIDQGGSLFAFKANLNNVLSTVLVKQIGIEKFVFVFMEKNS